MPAAKAPRMLVETSGSKDAGSVRRSGGVEGRAAKDELVNADVLSRAFSGCYCRKQGFATWRCWADGGRIEPAPFALRAIRAFSNLPSPLLERHTFYMYMTSPATRRVLYHGLACTR